MKQIQGRLIHVEVALQYSLLHSVRLPGLLRHLANGGFHDGNALCALVRWNTHHRRRARNRATLGSGAEVLREVVTFACRRPCQRADEECKKGGTVGKEFDNEDRPRPRPPVGGEGLWVEGLPFGFPTLPLPCLTSRIALAPKLSRRANGVAGLLPGPEVEGA